LKMKSSLNMVFLKMFGECNGKLDIVLLLTQIRFHVDNLSSAHVYIRMKKGVDLKDIPPAVLEDCAQLVKQNSIQGTHSLLPLSLWS